MSQIEQGPPSASTRPPSRQPMQLVGERQIPEMPTATAPTGIAGLMAANQPETARTTTPASPAPGSPQFQAEYLHRAVWRAAVLGNLNALAMVLAVRVSALIAVCGAIFLSWVALGSSGHPDPYASLLLGVYLLGASSVVWLASRK